MAVVTIFSASFCGENEVAAKLAEKLSYESISEKLINETSKRFNVSEDKLRHSLSGHVSFLNNITHEREKNIAYLKSTLADLIKKDNMLYHGFASHLLPKYITHVLKVCILANHEYRIKTAMKQEKISEKQAKSIIENDDKERIKWAQYVLDSSPWDEKLYDVVIPLHTSSVDESVDLISENVKKKALETTPESRKALDDFLLASRVSIPLVENGYDLNVVSDDGNVNISPKEFLVRFEHMKEKIKKIVNPVSGVKDLKIVKGQGVRLPSKYDELEAPPRFLLVDDEKEYIQTLSERLNTRDLESAIAYDGEEALSYMEKDEPDVMVLDLKMPGVDGIEVLRKVKKERPHVEVIILTGHGSKKDRELVMELGAFAYLEKPVDIDVLTKTMREAYKKLLEAGSS